MKFKRICLSIIVIIGIIASSTRVHAETDPRIGNLDSIIEETMPTNLMLSTTDAQDFTYNDLSDGTIEITGYTGSAINVVIPSEIDGKRVTALWDGGSSFSGYRYGVFARNANIMSVTIPEGITSIGRYCFYSCSSLMTVEIPNGVTTIREEAFLGCSSLMNINLPESLETIEYEAFYSCSSLMDIELPDSLTTIRSCAFEGSGLTSIEIPENVTRIASGTFSNCSNLSEVILPDTLIEIEEGSFLGAFAYCNNLIDIKLPDSLESIGSNAFNRKWINFYRNTRKCN